MSKISVVISTRNDDFYEDNISRVSNMLNTNLFFLDKIGMLSSVEFNIVDWGSSKPLNEEIKLVSEYKENVNFFYVNEDTSKKFSEFYPNKFNLDVAPNVGLRFSKGDFIIQGTSDQILSRSGWFNLVNIINNNEKFYFDANKTIFYIPRKIIEYDWYKKNPSIQTLEEFLDYSNASYFNIKNTTFYVGGGYSLLCKREILQMLGGINSENNKPGSANDMDLNTRIKRLGIKQIDTSSLGVFFYKFPSEINSKRNQIRSLGRRLPPFPLQINPNKNSWGLRDENIEITKSINLIEIDNYFKVEKFQLLKKHLYKLKFSQKLSILSKFNKFNLNLNEWELLFNIIKITNSSRIFSLIEIGFHNPERLIVLGRKLKSIDILSFDFMSEKKIDKYLNRQPEAQFSLSTDRIGKFTTISSLEFSDFSYYLDKMNFESGSSLLIINSFMFHQKNIKDKLNDVLKKISSETSFLILCNSSKLNKKKLDEIDNKFKLVFDRHHLKIYFNRDINISENDLSKLFFKNNIFDLIILIFSYSILSFYQFAANILKSLHKKIFRFKH